MPLVLTKEIDHYSPPVSALCGSHVEQSYGSSSSPLRGSAVPGSSMLWKMTGSGETRPSLNSVLGPVVCSVLTSQQSSEPSLSAVPGGFPGFSQSALPPRQR